MDFNFFCAFFYDLGKFFPGNFFISHCIAKSFQKFPGFLGGPHNQIVLVFEQISGSCKGYRQNSGEDIIGKVTLDGIPYPGICQSNCPE
jgi:hypothetical protein